MIRIVLDTNVFVSGLFWSGVPSRILNAWEENKIQLVFSQEIMEEYARIAHALASKKNACQVSDVSAALELVAVYGELTLPALLDAQICDDPDDDKFIACALGAKCPLIVSGDKKLLNCSGYAGVIVLEPAEFFSRFINGQ